MWTICCCVRKLDLCSEAINIHIRRRNCTWALDFRWWWYLMPTLLTKIFHRKLACLLFLWQYSTSTMDIGRKYTNFRTIAESARVYSFFATLPSLPSFYSVGKGSGSKNFTPVASHSVYCMVYFIGHEWWTSEDSFARSSGDFWSVYFCVCIAKSLVICSVLSAWVVRGKPPFPETYQPFKFLQKGSKITMITKVFISLCFMIKLKQYICRNDTF